MSPLSKYREKKTLNLDLQVFGKPFKFKGRVLLIVTAAEHNLFHNMSLFFSFFASNPIPIMHAHGGSYWLKRKARGCCLLVNRATESLLVVTLNLLNYVFIKGGGQKQAISRWRRQRH